MSSLNSLPSSFSKSRVLESSSLKSKSLQSSLRKSRSFYSSLVKSKSFSSGLSRLTEVELSLEATSYISLVSESLKKFYTDNLVNNVKKRLFESDNFNLEEKFQDFVQSNVNSENSLNDGLNNFSNETESSSCNTDKLLDDLIYSSSDDMNINEISDHVSVFPSDNNGISILDCSPVDSDLFVNVVNKMTEYKESFVSSEQVFEKKIVFNARASDICLIKSKNGYSVQSSEKFIHAESFASTSKSQSSQNEKDSKIVETSMNVNVNSDKVKYVPVINLDKNEVSNIMNSSVLHEVNEINVHKNNDIASSEVKVEKTNVETLKSRSLKRKQKENKVSGEENDKDLDIPVNVKFTQEEFDNYSYDFDTKVPPNMCRALRVWLAVKYRRKELLKDKKDRSVRLAFLCRYFGVNERTVDRIAKSGDLPIKHNYLSPGENSKYVLPRIKKQKGIKN